MLLQYDVELYQRIEHLIGKQLPLYKTEEEEVMILQERVSEAQRVAKIVSYPLFLLLSLWAHFCTHFCSSENVAVLLPFEFFLNLKFIYDVRTSDYIGRFFP
jgi:hypothetical protein